MHGGASCQISKYNIDLVAVAGAEEFDIPLDGGSRGLQVRSQMPDIRIARIDEGSEARGRRQ